MDSVIIDGTTQPGFAGTPLIQIIGTKMERTSLSGASLHLTCFGIYGDGSTIKGLDINSFYEFGSNQLWGGTPIQILGNNNVIVGNFIGTDVTGTLALPNLQGVLVNGLGNRIGGTTPAERNLISGNFDEGMIVSGTPDGPANLIEGNFIGTDVTGTKALGNGRGISSGSFGISLNYKNILGGSAPGAGNVISANLGDGVILHEAMGTIIQGNFIGTDVTGTKKLGNSGGSGITYNENDFPAPTLGVTIGGTQTGARNIISNNSFGIFLNSHADIVQGNYIGTDITGTLDFGNLNDGIVVVGDNHLIGGTAPGAGNLISGNNRNGISLALANSSSGNVIQGNRIGTQADGVSPLGNSSDGITIAAGLTGSTDGDGPINNLIGGLDSGASNIIAFNGRRGVNILAGPTAFASADFTIENAVTGAAIDSTNMSVAFDPANHTATIAFPGLPGAHLPDGRYQLSIAGANDYTFNFFRLTGDANQDATVNFSDLVIVAQNYGKTDSRLGWSDGDFTGDGAVSFADLVALAQNYGRILSPLPAPVIGLELPEPAPLPTPAAVPAPSATQTSTTEPPTSKPAPRALQVTPSPAKPPATSPKIAIAPSAIEAKPQSVTQSQVSRFSRARLTIPANRNSVVTSVSRVGITPLTAIRTPSAISNAAPPPFAPLAPHSRKRSTQDAVFF